jgi:hypothetical protein
MATETRNAREQLDAAAHWLGWQDEALSNGLRSPEDGLKLWSYWQANPNLPEMADEDIGPNEMPENDNRTVAEHRVAAVGYDPLGEL